MRLEHRGGVGVLGAADDDDPPAVVEEPGDQGLPVPRRPALGRRPGPEVDGQQRGRGAEPAGVQPVGARRRRIASGRRREPRAARRPARPRRRRAATASWPRPARLGRARPRGASGRPATRSRSVDVDRTRAGPSAAMPRRSSRASREPTSWRPGTQSATSVSRNAAAAHRPADPPGDAGQGQDEHRQDVAPDVDAQVVAAARGATGRAPRRPSPAPSGPVGARTSSARPARTRSTFGSASKTSRLLGEASTSIVASG